MERVPVLISRDRIATRVRELAAEIVAAESRSGVDDLVLMVLLNGAFVFAADLLRALDEEGAAPAVDFLAVSSYGMGAVSSGDVEFRCRPKREVAGLDVLLIDDIVDTGRSLAAVKQWMLDHGAKRVLTCALLDKPSRRQVAIETEFCGFEVPDRFLVGYGLDHAERYRHLPYVGVVET